MTRGGREPVTLGSGESRRFLEDGDEVTFRAHCSRTGYVSIGFGECRGRIAAA
jgi:fumarylacetoacetase